MRSPANPQHHCQHDNDETDKKDRDLDEALGFNAGVACVSASFCLNFIRAPVPSPEVRAAHAMPGQSR